eukprot:jgi/Mesvir1/26579/Mv16232-RA.3
MEGGADGSLSSARRAQFKGGKTNPAEAGARRRRDDAVAIRKERKEVLLRAKRIRRDEDSAMPAGADGDGNTMELGGEALERECVSAVQRLEKSGATQDVVSSLRHLRRLLSQGEEPPVGAAVRAGAVPLLCAALAPSPRWSEEAALEAAWCLTNIAAGDDGECSAALAPALSLLAAHINAGGSLPLVEQCVWALGNLCGENEDMRAAVHATGTPVQMVALLRSPRASLPKTAAWALSNLLKGKSHRGAELLHAPGFGEALVELLGSSDRELVVEVAWVLTYVTAESEHNTGQLINLGLLPALCLQFCDATEHALVIPPTWWQRSCGAFKVVTAGYRRRPRGSSPIWQGGRTAPHQMPCWRKACCRRWCSCWWTERGWTSRRRPPLRSQTCVPVGPRLTWPS